MILEIYTKNFALTASIKLPAGPVPRVGEAIELDQDVGYLQNASELLIHEVVWVLKENTLTPVVRCHVGSAEHHRLLILEQQGWLQP